ncbi:MAG: DNA translocase FtsK 4TM domain-containing protein, partial [Planctomycetota bacterium]|nr:DNA translocase FtsK 4TM domain-containing protein [Planctomycetota bacterium]
MPRKKTPSTANEFDAGVFFVGLFLVGLGIFLLFSFATADVTLDPQSASADCATGLLGAWAAYGAILTLGDGAAYVLALLLIAWGAHVAREQKFWSTWPQVLGGLLMLIAISN